MCFLDGGLVGTGLMIPLIHHISKPYIVFSCTADATHAIRILDALQSDILLLSTKYAPKSRFLSSKHILKASLLLGLTTESWIPQST